ncbi:glycosyltransferase family 2 protein [Phaeobacter gallaeciensis]|uniref:Glycosyltransferase n=1 Tax=Phaeobacter gallaeciensis TaxID=60890 RepID=A0AAC9ZBG7_9RHOB|nr:glycosyltransferase family 2 protein [Phaeobacter gallaeciensis]AHD11443.1 putative glycosyltransferase [Phaeobacter gallaeciensis DSM 26640]ATE94707.1 putative glycosyltransferase [Phaeobacter gallaeciensis]ATE98979.1 putative glycosyltransferase [Phaeobacter gallaeciensis]ATF03371.1 putative glycosyltransferase [Phaeobacter gallaeciensis]ATF07751.1 putative glycosyltransferase [Phaeobacter gallaeciensis]
MTERISILLCTYRRRSVVETLESLAALRAPTGYTIDIIVADNDEALSSEHWVRGATASWPVSYIHAPARNISVARNACLALARNRQSDWVAFVDDDEVVPADWIEQLMRRAVDTGADVISGPAIACYPADAPDWMVDQDWHSNWPELRGPMQTETKQPQTAHSCNALMRFAGQLWEGQVFDLDRGTSGGEDTAYFFALSHMGARFAISAEAPVFEDVAPERLRLGWLAKRRFRMGQSYVSGAPGSLARIRLAGAAMAKVAYCAGAGLIALPSEQRRNFWLLRGLLHLGVLAGCCALPQPKIYGDRADREAASKRVRG